MQDSHEEAESTDMPGDNLTSVGGQSDDVSNEKFSDFNNENAKKYIEYVFAQYSKYVDFLESGAIKASVEAIDHSRKEKRWRILLLSMTGLVAILNTLAAYSLFESWWLFSVEEAPSNATDDANSTSGRPHHVSFASIMTMAAALFAVFATVLSNFENYLAHGPKAAIKKRVCERYYEAHLRFRAKWITMVPALGNTPKGCDAAASLLNAVVEEFSAVRKQAGEAVEKDGSSSGSNSG